jgi:hypothetical protein
MVAPRVGSKHVLIDGGLGPNMAQQSLPSQRLFEVSDWITYHNLQYARFLGIV